MRRPRPFVAIVCLAVLASSALVVAQIDTAVWVVWIREHDFPIRSIVATPADDFSDLQFPKTVVGDRRLVQLGESEQMGFDVIKSTQDTAHPLVLAGFDTQISSASGVAQCPAFQRRVVAALDADYADEVAAFDRTSSCDRAARRRSCRATSTTACCSSIG